MVDFSKQLKAPATQHRVIPVEWHRVAVEPDCDHRPQEFPYCTKCGEKASCLWPAANTDDRQADTIPDELREMYDASESAVEVYLIQRTGHAETRIEVLEAALRAARPLVLMAYNHESVIRTIDAALDAPSGEKP